MLRHTAPGCAPLYGPTGVAHYANADNLAHPHSKQEFAGGRDSVQQVRLWTVGAQIQQSGELLIPLPSPPRLLVLPRLLYRRKHSISQSLCRVTHGEK